MFLVIRVTPNPESSLFSSSRRQEQIGVLSVFMAFAFFKRLLQKLSRLWLTFGSFCNARASVGEKRRENTQR